MRFTSQHGTAGPVRLGWLISLGVIQPLGRKEPHRKEPAAVTDRDPVAASVALYGMFRTGVELPLVSGARVLGLMVFGLGVAACVLGGGGTPAGGDQRSDDAWRRLLGGHGLVAFLLAALVVVTASTGLLAALVVLVVLLWVVTTARHAVTPIDDRHRIPDGRPLARHSVGR